MRANQMFHDDALMTPEVRGLSHGMVCTGTSQWLRLLKVLKCDVFSTATIMKKPTEGIFTQIPNTLVEYPCCFLLVEGTVHT